CIAPNTNPRAMNWKSGCAGRKSRGEHSRAGILRDWKFGQAAESEHASYLQICDRQQSDHRLSPPLSSSLLNLKLTKGGLTTRWPSSTMRVCYGQTRSR